MALRGASSAASTMEDDGEARLMPGGKPEERGADRQGRGRRSGRPARRLLYRGAAQALARSSARHVDRWLQLMQQEAGVGLGTMFSRDDRPIRIGWCGEDPVRWVNLDWEGVSVASSPSGETGDASIWHRGEYFVEKWTPKFMGEKLNYLG